MRTLLVALGAVLSLAAPVVDAQQDPPRRIDLSPESQEPRRTTDRAVANGFVRDQTILGAFLYAPAFATAVGSDGVTSAAAYLVVAGGTFFMATELTRRIEITEARRDLAFSVPLRGAATVWLLSYATDLEAAQTASVVFLGSIGGLAGGLAMGRGLTAGEGAATIFGHDLFYLSSLALTQVIAGRSGEDPLDVRDRPGRVAAWTGAGVAGLLLGRRYAANASHNVTVGDVQTMWLGMSIGALGSTALIVDSGAEANGIAAALLAGGLAGTWAAERYLVRRYDHTRGEGNVLALGATAGAVMGVGLGVLVGGELERGSSLTLGLATLGAVGGLALTERYLQPAGDRGKLTTEVGRLRLDPMAGLAAAARAPGRHTLLTFTF
jgi:hypothetical protein